MTRGTGRALRLIASGAAIALLVHLGRSVGWRETWAALRRASPWLIFAAAVVNFASLVARGLRWSIFLRAVGVAGWGLGVRGAVVGSGFNNLVPASGGDAARVIFVAKRAGISSAVVLATLALDRLVDVVSFALLLALAPVLEPLPAVLGRWSVPAASLLLALVALLVVLVWYAQRPGAPALPTPGPAPRPRGARAYASRFLAGLAVLPTPARLAPALGLSVIFWAGQIATFQLAARAAALRVPIMASVAAMLAVNIAFLFPLTPGNLGIFQLLYALVMAAFGISRATAVAVALLIQAIQILPVTAAALALAPRLIVHRARPEGVAEGGTPS